MFTYWGGQGSQGGAKVCATVYGLPLGSGAATEATSDAKERSRYFPLPLGTESFFAAL